MDSRSSILSYILKNRYIANTCLFDDIRSLNYSVIKGEVLSLYAYCDFGKRISTDIDILVSKDSISLLEKSLIKNGFSCCCTEMDKRFLRVYTHQNGIWNKQITPIDNVSIDINHDLFWGEYSGKRIDVNEFISDNVELDIYGVRVKALTPIKAFIQLLLHNYKDLNSIFLLATRKGLKQTLFKDVFCFIKNNLKEASLDELYNKCLEYQIFPYVYYVLYFTGQLYPNEILNKYIDAFRTEEGEALLPCYGLSEAERKIWKYDFKTRINAKNMYELIKDDLNESDKKKIDFNKRIMMGL